MTVKNASTLDGSAVDKPVDTSGYFSIAAVDRDTGLPKDTLRVWERRYGFPAPLRDHNDERIYSLEQVEKLRLIRRLIDVGHRPSKVVNLDMSALTRMSEPREIRRRTAGRIAYSPEKRVSLKRYLDLIQLHDIDKLRQQLAQSQLKLGLSRFVTERVSPLTQMVWDAGLRGQLATFGQKAFNETAKRVLYSAIGSMPSPSSDGAPKVLLTSFAHDFSGIGILMAEALLTMEGAPCISLGVETAVLDIIQAQAKHQSHIVVLSFSEGANPGDILSGVGQLRGAIADEIEIWVSGPCQVLIRKPVDGVLVIPGIEELVPELARWRKTHEQRLIDPGTPSMPKDDDEFLQDE